MKASVNGWLSGFLTIVVSGTCSGVETPNVYLHGAVAADHPAASAAGVEILKQGGNVIDAAAAVSLALSVVRPDSSGLGGGGFVVHWDAASRHATAWDYRERAPLAATAGMFVDAEKQGRQEASEHGLLAVAVPGLIPGWAEIHRRGGKLSWQKVVEPALRLAAEGVPLDGYGVSIQRSLLADFARHPQASEEFAALWTGYLNSGRPYAVGDRFHSPQKAALEWLHEHGPAAYAEGPLGQALVRLCRQRGGIITMEDLRGMAPVQRVPLQGEFAGYQLLTMPPPSSGGIALLETLQILTEWSAREGTPEWSTLPDGQRLHVLAEALKHAFADRATYLGDRDFVDVPVERLLSREHARRLAAKIELGQTRPTMDYGKLAPVDDAGTTHFCVMDVDGNAVSCTETINTSFGSWVVEPTSGIVLNNEMDDFTAFPGRPNAFGLTQSESNLIAPRKKPLSSMTPTIVVKDGRAVAIAGASGGPRIITATLQVLLGMLLQNKSAQAAVDEPRIHHQWLPNELLLEPGWEVQQETLEKSGHVVRRQSRLAASQAIRSTAGGLDAGSDRRKDGRPAGY